MLMSLRHFGTIVEMFYRSVAAVCTIAIKQKLVFVNCEAGFTNLRLQQVSNAYGNLCGRLRLDAINCHWTNRTEGNQSTQKQCRYENSQITTYFLWMTQQSCGLTWRSSSPVAWWKAESGWPQFDSQCPQQPAELCPVNDTLNIPYHLFTHRKYF